MMITDVTMFKILLQCLWHYSFSDRKGIWTVKQLVHIILKGSFSGLWHTLKKPENEN